MTPGNTDNATSTAPLQLTSRQATSSRWLLIVLLLIANLAISHPAQAQNTCGVVDAIDYPLDPAQFGLVYEYGQPSTRHDGRYHAGDDWYGPRGATYGAPVRAIARGRVTYSAPWGWGRDKGVVIIEHALPDGSTWYSLYGHMEEVGGVTFPARYSCVEMGDIIGAVGHPRPAPHLHLEIRDFWPDNPGPGYYPVDPVAEGWTNPMRFIETWAARLNPAVAWQADLEDASGPAMPGLLREDGTLLVYDENGGNKLIRALGPDGGLIWQRLLPESLHYLGLLDYQGQIAAFASDGSLFLLNPQSGDVIGQLRPGTIGPDAPLLTWDDLLVVHTPGNELVAYGPGGAVRWRVSDISAPQRMQATSALFGVIDSNGLLTLVAPDGALIGQEVIGAGGDLAPALGDGLYVLRTGSLAQVGPDGTWLELAAVPVVDPTAGALFSLPDGRFFVFSGGQTHTLSAYSPDGSALWATPLPGLAGEPILVSDGLTLALADGSGAVLALRAADGALCNRLDLYGTPASDVWGALGADGLLRLHIGAQVTGIDWANFTAGCP